MNYSIFIKEDYCREIDAKINQYVASKKGSVDETISSLRYYLFYESQIPPENRISEMEELLYHTQKFVKDPSHQKKFQSLVTERANLIIEKLNEQKKRLPDPNRQKDHESKDEFIHMGFSKEELSFFNPEQLRFLKPFLSSLVELKKRGVSMQEISVLDPYLFRKVVKQEKAVSIILDSGVSFTLLISLNRFSLTKVLLHPKECAELYKRGVSFESIGKMNRNELHEALKNPRNKGKKQPIPFGQLISEAWNSFIQFLAKIVQWITKKLPF